MREKGATLIELAIALGVVGILIAATAFAYQGWMEKYKVEKATSELYTDLMRARLLAIQTNRKHFAVLNDFTKFDDDYVLDNLCHGKYSIFIRVFIILDRFRTFF